MMQSKPHQRRSTRPLPLAAASLAVALAAAPHAAAQQAQQIDREERLLEFAQCMRENGYAEFPDPGPNGRLEIRLDPSAAPRFQAAQEACRDLAPMGVASGPPDPERMEQLVSLAQCIRDNGVAEFPDPNAMGEFSITGLSVDMQTPQAQAALETCVQAESAAGRRGVIRITR